MADEADIAHEQTEVHDRANIANSGATYKTKVVNTCLHCGMANDRRFEGYATCQDCADGWEFPVGGEK
jgi:hypothetical protein